MRQKSVSSKAAGIKTSLVRTEWNKNCHTKASSANAAFNDERLWAHDLLALSGITTDQRLVVSDVAQKAFIEVNEKGSEAAAATAMMFGLCCYMPDPEFKCDKPFMLFVKDGLSGLMLFAGIVSNPNKTWKLKSCYYLIKVKSYFQEFITLFNLNVFFNH